MSTGTANTSPAKKYVPCPKCYGGKVFTNWSHIAGGKCFCCAGNGDVEESRAAKFGYVAPVAPDPKKYRNIDLGGVFGPASITKIEGGYLRVTWGRGIPGESGGMADFRVINGRIVDLDASDSPRRRGEVPALVAALQACLKV